MEKVSLNADLRIATGTAAAQRLRREGIVPCIVYKAKEPTVSLQFKERDLEKALSTEAGTNVLITLKIKSENKTKARTVIVKEIQRDPLKQKIKHVDFVEISLTELIKVKVAIIVKGEEDCPGIKVDEGVLGQPLHEVEVECLPTQIPANFEVKIAGMNIGDVVRVKDLMAPEGVKILSDPEDVVVSIEPPAKIEEVAAAPAESEEGVTEPEVITEKKEEAPTAEESKKEAPKEEKKAE